MITTAGKLLLNDALPEKYRQDLQELTADQVRNLFTRIAKEDPDLYEDTLHKLTTLSKEVVTSYGNEAGVSLKDFETPREVHVLKLKARDQIQQIVSSPRYSAAEKEKLVVKTLSDLLKTAPDVVLQAAKAQNSGLATQVLSGARGSKASLTQILLGDIMLADAQDRPVPIPALHGYAEGVTPLEYWASSNGARKGAVSVQMGTARGGWLGKTIANVGHKLVVTEDDCGTANGYAVDATDPDNIGSVLTRDNGNIKAGTLITPENFRQLKPGKILVRSTITCQAKDGICSKCAGYRENGGLSAIGEPVGIVAVRAISEPVTQAALKVKHCLVKGTQVRMADYSIKNIEDIKPGDMVLGADRLAKTFPVSVVQTYDNGLREAYRFTYRKGGSTTQTVQIEATKDHKALQMTRKSSCMGIMHNGKVRELPLGEPCSKTSLILSEGFYDTTGVYEPWALALGLVLGDGCYTKSVNGCFLSCADESLITETKEYFADLNIKLTKLSGHAGIYYRLSSVVESEHARNNTTGQFEKAYANPIMCKLNELNMLHKLAHEKSIPSVAYTWDNKSVAALLGGLYITDGCLHYSSDNHGYMFMKYSSTSLTMVTQVKELLAWRFGVQTDNITARTKGTRLKHTLYTISINARDSVKKFIDNIPLYGVKQQRAKAYVFPNTRANLKYNRCRRLNIEPIGMQPTYDIQVDHPDHLFVLANGAVVSNSGGIAQGGTPSKISGFDEIEQFIQVPSTFKGGATLAKKDGTVTKVQPAPGGGWNILIDGADPHYVPADEKVTVKTGTKVLAGDCLSDGVPNPAELVEHKGIGEGRRYFVEQFSKILKNNKASVQRRNVEALARAFINRVEITDPDGYQGYIIGDTVPYDDFVKTYEPRTGSTVTKPKLARGSYLEQPVLHYSIGTRVTQPVVDQLTDMGISEVRVHAKPPPFKPVVVKARDILETDPDWMVRLNGENLKRATLNAATMGSTSTTKGTSYIPQVANAVSL